MGFSLGKTLSGAISGAISGGSVGGPAGAVVGGVIGAGSGYMDSYQDKQAMKYQQKQNIKLWNMQNAYNTPAAQMQRFMDAGLNPNLIYSQSNEAGAIQGATLGDTNSDIGGQITSANNNRLNTLQAYSSLASQATSRAESDARTQQIVEQTKQLPKLLKLRERQQDLAETVANSGVLGRWLGNVNAGQLNTLVADIVKSLVEQD